MPAIIVTVPGVLDTYASLVAAITEETDGRANSDALARFIKQAEGEIQVFLAKNPVRPMRTRGTISINGEYVAAPTDMVRPIAVEATSDSGTLYVSYVANENLSRMQGKYLANNKPYAFTREGNDLRFYPAPTQTYAGTLFYFQKLDGISAANSSNWLLAEYPHIYLAGALYYAYRDMPDIEKAGLMKSLFGEGLARLADAYPEPINEVTLSVDADMLPRRWSIMA